MYVLVTMGNNGAGNYILLIENFSAHSSTHSKTCGFFFFNLYRTLADYFLRSHMILCGSTCKHLKYFDLHYGSLSCYTMSLSKSMFMPHSSLCAFHAEQ